MPPQETYRRGVTLPSCDAYRAATHITGCAITTIPLVDEKRYVTGLLAPDLPLGIYDPIREAKALMRVSPMGAPKAGQVPLNHFPAMVDYLSKKTYRNVALKPRQITFSTAELADNLWRCIWVGNQNYCIVAHDDDLGKEMLRQVKIWIADLPKDIRPILGTPNNEDSLLIESTPSGQKINSFVWIVTAAGRNPGRGKRVNILHGTEVAMWDDDSVMGALEASVPAPPWGIVTYESTPKGARGGFYRQYKSAADAALTGSQDEQFKAFFYAWWWDPTNVRGPVPKGFMRTLREDEIEAARKAFDRDGRVLTPEQLYWRRLMKHSNDQKGKIFAQEYPEDDISCFITSEGAVFPVTLYEYLDAYKREPIRYPSEAPELPKGCQRHLSVWVEPRKGRRYVAGVDVGWGVGQDNSVVTVVDWETTEHVATLSTNSVLPDKFAELVDAMGRWYNDAYMCVERNTGLTVLTNLREKLKYPNIHWDRDQRTGKVDKEPGFNTDVASKPLLVSEFQELLGSKRFTTYDSALVTEMQTYVHTDARHTGAAADAHDDRLMAVMIAEYCRRWSRSPRSGHVEPVRQGF